MTLRATILGCGSSGGVPRIGGHWGACDPGNPRNRRRRCALLVEQDGPGGTTRVLIDTGPDLREQLLEAQVDHLDAVLYTHAHADHIHGIDDLRGLVMTMRRRIPVWADAETARMLRDRFGYVFETPPGSAYPPILELNILDGPTTIDGAGGALGFTPFTVPHGTIDALGFRVGALAYTPDVSDIPEAVWPVLDGLDTWIVDALRREPHPTHAHLDKALDWIARAQPARAVLTNMHLDLDYDTLAQETPEHVTPAHDGMQITLP